MWGRSVLNEFSNIIEFVGLCNINPGRLETVKQMLQVSCPTFTDFDKMMKDTKPEILIVTTIDGNHHEFIVKGIKLCTTLLNFKFFAILLHPIKHLCLCLVRNASKKHIAHKAP